MLSLVLSISVCAIASAIGLPACPTVPYQAVVERPSWRGEAEAACLERHDVSSSESITSLAAIDEPNGCGADHPLKVTAVSDGAVELAPAATLACPVIPALDAWLRRAVQPAAERHLGSPIVGLRVAASYHCRTRNRKPGARMSEHGFANAIDISEFKTADGRTITVLEGWGDDDAASAFLKAVHKDACTHFTTVIGPDGDIHHRDHIHLDLIRRGNKGFSRYCR